MGHGSKPIAVDQSSNEEAVWPTTRGSWPTHDPWVVGQTTVHWLIVVSAGNNSMVNSNFTFRSTLWASSRESCKASLKPSWKRLILSNFANWRLLAILARNAFSTLEDYEHLIKTQMEESFMSLMNGSRLNSDHYTFSRLTAASPDNGLQGRQDGILKERGLMNARSETLVSSSKHTVVTGHYSDRRASCL